jgi:hypothetical protein
MKSQYPADIAVRALFHHTGKSMAETVGLEEGKKAEGYIYLLW